MAKTPVRTFRIPIELWIELDAYSRENNVTKTSVLVQALEKMIGRKP